MQWAHQWLTRHPWGIEGSDRVALTEPHISAHHLLISCIPKPGEDREVDANGVQLQLSQATTRESTKSDVVKLRALFGKLFINQLKAEEDRTLAGMQQQS